MPIRTYRDLIVWQKGMDLATLLYQVTAGFPAAERFSLTAQLRRAAVSIPANLAEGHERHARGAFRRHVSIALGSALRKSRLTSNWLYGLVTFH